MKLNKLSISMKALIALENIHTKFEQNPMKTQEEEISNYFHGWRVETRRKKDTNSSLSPPPPPLPDMIKSYTSYGD